MKKILYTITIAASVMLLSCNNKAKQDTPRGSDEIESTTEQIAVTENEKVVTVLDFTATWCPPCQILAPSIEVAKKKYKGKVTIQKIDVDQSPAMAQNYNIQSIPTLIFLNAKGEEIRRTVGLISAEELDRYIQGN